MTIRRTEAERLIVDTEKDLSAFSSAFDALMRRLREREREGTVEDFADWPGTKAALNVLIMCRTRCEGLLEDLRKGLESLPPELALVREEDEDGQGS